ncbi:MAG: flagellar biosynthetic protein FliO [Rhodospirillales bacterium]|nr:flagellar biosynthetic protein FliO [Alphaproteobacteria bacterium]MBL6947978.1 flagellar biosynthetic protein FliO [Rhodospirillales bacterium]
MEFSEYLRFFLALVFVIGLIGAAAAMARRMGFGFPSQAIKKSTNRRLAVVEAAPLDGRRRMVLIRRDDTEHLLVLSPNGETVIESGIRAKPEPDGTSTGGNNPEDQA